ncbi:hypothetical protein RND81_06G176200 [Saponaria officinalis]
MAQSAGGAIEILKKQKTDEDWSCALCRITATSERGLIEHLQGKKHKTREKSMVLKKDEKVHNAANQDHFVNKDNQTVVKSKEISAEETKNGVSKRKFRYFCEMCQARADSLKVFNRHKRGRLHLANLSELNKAVDVLPIEASVEIAVTGQNKDAEIAVKETNEETEREPVGTYIDDVDSDLNQIEDEIDGEVNRVEDKAMILETKGDNVGSEANQVEDKEKVQETEGDDIDNEVNQVEDKEKVQETKGDDIDSEVNQVEDKEMVLEIVGGEGACF